VDQKSRNYAKIPLAMRRLEPVLRPSLTPPPEPQFDERASIMNEQNKKIVEEDLDSNEEVPRTPEIASPISSVSSFRSDPFSSFPVPIPEKDRALVNHCSLGL
jgi:hypothetical protein